MVKECRHRMPSGLNCKSPAMRGSAFCYFHGRTNRFSRPGRPAEARIELPSTLNEHGIQDSLSQILNLLASGRIGSRRAAVLLYGLQMASSQEALPPGSLAQAASLPSRTQSEADGVLGNLAANTLQARNRESKPSRRAGRMSAVSNPTSRI